MSSAVNIQIVSMPNLAKIENFLKDVSYRETIEYSANFNTRLCIERRLRLPFLDPQTGVAQNHSQLFMDKRQRMPGFRQGQIYTYPAARWRKSRRQYLTKMYSRFPERPFQALRKEHEALVASGVNLGIGLSGLGGGVGGGGGSSSSSLSLNMLTGAGTTTPSVLAALHSDTTHDFNGAFSLEESSSLGAAGGDTSDSKDSQQQQQQHHHQHHQQQQQSSSHSKDDLPKEWFYDDMDMNDVDSLEEPKSPADDEYDYDPRYGNKKRRKRRAGKRGTSNAAGGDGGGGGGGGGVGSSGGSSARRRSGVTRTRITTTDAALDASLEAIELGDSLPGSNGGGCAGGGGGGGTPTSSSGVGNNGGGSGVGGGAGGRRSRGVGTRGRRRTKGVGGSSLGGSASGLSHSSCDPHSPGMVIEPPSFESAAAAVGVGGVVEDGNAHLRNYRKYL